MITLFLRGDLPTLVRKQFHPPAFQYESARRASIKDILESLGIPHTEVGRIEARGEERSFQYIPGQDERINIFPFTCDIYSSMPTKLWPLWWPMNGFLVDGNVRKVGRNLRMVGVDVLEIPQNLDLKEIGEDARRRKRVLITRNRDLLECSTVYLGQLLRSQSHVEQLTEVVNRYGLRQELQPFSRCIACNGLLVDVSKEKIDHLLEPLTRKYYFTFKRCRGCEKLYWRGSHWQKMKNLIATLR